MGSHLKEDCEMSKKYKGVRRRKWGKWVSEIRVPGSQERLWLGSYSSAEAAAVAHDVAYYCLRRPSSSKQLEQNLNFPPMLPPLINQLLIRDHMSPASIQKAASDAAMAIDAHYICNSGGGGGSTSSSTAGPSQHDLSIEDYLSSV